jgi:hypothetical protein
MPEQRGADLFNCGVGAAEMSYAAGAKRDGLIRAVASAMSVCRFLALA